MSNDPGILSPFLGLVMLWLGWLWLRTFSPPRGRERSGFIPQSPGAPTSNDVVEAEIVSVLPSDLSPRVLVATAMNTCDHPYDEMPLTDLQTHLYEAHFECWNLVGERNPSPKKWREHHANDHGLEIR